MKRILIALFLTGSVSVFAQSTNCDAVLEENKKLQDQLAIAIKQNDYFRETLKIMETKIKTVTDSKIDFNLLSCEGNSQDQSVTLQFVLLNHDVNKDIFLSPDRESVRVTDLQGNQYSYEKIKFGEASWSTKLNTEVPAKLTITLPGVLPSIMLLKMIDLKCTIKNAFPQSDIVFKDISINWR